MKKIFELRDERRGGLRVIATDKKLVCEYELHDFMSTGWERHQSFDQSDESLICALEEMIKAMRSNAENEFYADYEPSANRDHLILYFIDHLDLERGGFRIVEKGSKIALQAKAHQEFEDLTYFENSEIGLNAALIALCDNLEVMISNGFYSDLLESALERREEQTKRWNQIEQTEESIEQLELIISCIKSRNDSPSEEMPSDEEQIDILNLVIEQLKKIQGSAQ